MTTKLYRLYQPGNPQNRVFLPNFWMKLMKPKYHHPPNHVLFEIHPEMTSHDVRQYLTKIYNIPVRDIRLRVETGEVKRPEYRRYLDATDKVKDPDRKLAYCILAKYVRFTYPDILPADPYEAELKKEDRATKYLEKQQKKSNEAAKSVPYKTSDWWSNFT